MPAAAAGRPHGREWPLHQRAGRLPHRERLRVSSTPTFARQLIVPALLASHPPLREPADLLTLPLLRTPLQPWSPWLRASARPAAEAFSVWLRGHCRALDAAENSSATG
ncbi:MAG: hypothetical protein EOP35_10670 [Rubrivivax sp.]|nr:MAG: hypothetical protein EOP35_10670 [Rubrivivax sp.]